MRLSYLDCEIIETDPIYALFTTAVVVVCLIPSYYFGKNEGNALMASCFYGQTDCMSSFSLVS